MYSTLTEMTTDVADAIRLKDGTAIAIPVQDFGDRIRAIPSGGEETPHPESPLWQRPLDRPDVPEIENDSIILLFGTSANSPNDLAFNVSCTSEYSVDWGDGIVTTHTTGTVAEHFYDDSSITQPRDSNGYKMVWVTVTPTVGDILSLNIQARSSLRPTVAASVYVPQVFEMYIDCPAITSIVWNGTNARYGMLEIFSLKQNSITSSLDFLLANCVNLRRIDDLYINNVSSLSSFLNGCVNYNYPFPSYVTFNNVTNSFMQECNSYNQPFSEGVTFSNALTHFMYNCTSYDKKFPDSVTFSRVTGYFMYGCSNYDHSFPSAVTFSTVDSFFMNLCRSYNREFPEGVTFNNVTGGFMQDCNSYNAKFPDGVTFQKATTGFMSNCVSYDQPFPASVTLAAVSSAFMNSCFTYNQRFPDGVTFSLATTSFMHSCKSYNQPFPESVTFANSTTHFMFSCFSYNQPFPSSLVFPNVGDYFLNLCSAFNRGVTVNLLGRAATVGTNFIGAGNFAQKWLRLLNMNSNVTAVNIGNSDMDTDALSDLFGDLYDRTGISAGTITISGSFGASKLTSTQRAIAVDKNWTVVG
jgi:hypothetical protein